MGYLIVENAHSRRVGRNLFQRGWENILGRNPMKLLISGIRKFWTDDEGLETVEYAIAAGMITAAVVTAIGLLGGKIVAVINALAGHLNPS